MQKRLLVRWANAARSKAETSTDSTRRQELEQAAKRLQIMESAIKIHRGWVFRAGAQEKSWLDFSSSWEVLEQFASSTPAQPLRCNFLWSLRLQILVYRVQNLCAEGGLPKRPSVSGWPPPRFTNFHVAGAQFLRDASSLFCAFSSNGAAIYSAGLRRRIYDGVLSCKFLRIYLFRGLPGCRLYFSGPGQDDYEFSVA